MNMQIIAPIVIVCMGLGVVSGLMKRLENRASRSRRKEQVRTATPIQATKPPKSRRYVYHTYLRPGVVSSEWLAQYDGPCATARIEQSKHADYIHFVVSHADRSVFLARMSGDNSVIVNDLQELK